MWPFKQQAYKKVRFEVNLYTDFLYAQYFPLQLSSNFPWAINENLCIIPEEKNVLIKKIVVQQNRNFVTYFNNPCKDWKFLYTFLDRSEAEKFPVRGNVQNATSGAFLPPLGSANYFSSCNSYKSENNYGEGIVAGGLRLHYFEVLGYNKSFSVFQPAQFLWFYVTIYYQDIDE